MAFNTPNFGNVGTPMYNTYQYGQHNSYGTPRGRGYRNYPQRPTFNVKEASNSDEEFVKFLQAYKVFERRHESNIWILKPGEDANRGQGIQVTTSLPEVCEIINAAKALKGPSPTKPNDWLELLRRKSDYN